MAIKLIQGRPQGLLPAAWDALKGFPIEASQVVQTVGEAKPSGKTHEPDGTFTNEEGQSEEYCAAVDLSVLHPEELNRDQIKVLLGRLTDAGFAPFARLPGQDHWLDPEHIHAIWADCPMKDLLRNQVHSFCDVPMLNGLRSNVPYKFWQPTPVQQQGVRERFLAHNPADH